MSTWPTQLYEDDELKAIKRARGWVVRGEQRRRVQPFFVKNGTLYTYWPDGRIEIEINGQDLLGFYTTKRAAVAMIQILEAARPGSGRAEVRHARNLKQARRRLARIK
jgi:hypothetical protein